MKTVTKRVTCRVTNCVTNFKIGQAFTLHFSPDDFIRYTYFVYLLVRHRYTLITM